MKLKPSKTNQKKLSLKEQLGVESLKRTNSMILVVVGGNAESIKGVRQLNKKQFHYWK